MATYRIALNFEDGVTRFVDCREGEKLLDAAYRSQINLPMDCSDGVCGTCKCRSEAGSYDLGDDYIEDALSADEAAERLVLTCQMRPTSDGIVAVPSSSAVCKTGQQKLAATVASVTAHEDAAVVLELDVEGAAGPAFLPGQYVNIDVPGSTATRSYSFTSKPGENRLGFLIKKQPGGLMSTWLDRAKPGDRVTFTGPMGSFYLRETVRPLLFLAGGTGLAPSSPCWKFGGESAGSTDPPRLRRDAGSGSGAGGCAGSLCRAPAGFTFTTVVADKASAHPRTGWVTDHMPADLLGGGAVDVYLCGPPPMVDAVRSWLSQNGVTPNSFHYEKFTPNLPLKESA